MKKVLLITGLTVSGVALACAQKAMPPLPRIDVSLFDIAVATVQGYSNPSNAAAMKGLDKAASSAVGASNWKTNNYVGPVAFSVTLAGATGANIVTINKPCGKKALQMTPPPTQTYTGSGSGGGGYYWVGGSVFGPAGTCLYGCGAGTVTVGDVDPV